MRHDAADTIRRIWWLPDAPANQTVGDLSLSDDSQPVLDLVGILKPPEHFNDHWSTPVVYGQPVKGQPVTLLACHETQWSLHGPGIITQRLAAFGGALIGIHLGSADDEVWRRTSYSVVVPRRQPIDDDQRVVVAGNREGANPLVEDLDDATCVGLQPDRRRRRSDMTQHRTKDPICHVAAIPQIRGRTTTGGALRTPDRDRESGHRRPPPLALLGVLRQAT